LVVVVVQVVVLHLNQLLDLVVLAVVEMVDQEQLLDMLAQTEQDLVAVLEVLMIPLTSVPQEQEAVMALY
jgi:hypothetical protein